MKTKEAAKKGKLGKNREETDPRRSVWEVPEKLCYAGFYIFLLAFMVFYVFYAPEGYIQIATNKYLFFRKMAIITGGIMIPFIVLRYLFALWKKSRSENERMLSVSLTDVFVILFLMVNCISFFLTPYKEEAIWGTSGWYMGFAMMFSFVGIYFLASRFYDGKVDLFLPFMGVTSVVFLWGLLNRFSIYPIDMQYENVSFISSIGNINWFCGYWSVFFVIGAGLYLVTEKRFLRIAAAVYCTLSLALGVVEGSDSAYISMGVVFFFLFMVSFQKTGYMKRWLEEVIFLCGACQIMRVIAGFGPEDPTQAEGVWGGLNLINPTIELMLGNLTLLALIVFILLWFLLRREDKRFEESNALREGLPEIERIRKYIWLKYTVIGLTTAAAAVFLLLIIINTRTPGILGPLSKYKILLFDGSWGSNRGATWRDGLLVYQSLPLRERLFGVGQDCFSIYGYSVPELAARFTEEWPSSRLTNAHNECITFLVDIGVFGMLSFIGIFFSSFTCLLKKAKKEPVCYVFAASLLSYFCHNQFSFSQVMNIPFIFLMLGLAENLMRRDTAF